MCFTAYLFVIIFVHFKNFVYLCTRFEREAVRLYAGLRFEKNFSIILKKVFAVSEKAVSLQPVSEATRCKRDGVLSSRFEQLKKICTVGDKL